MKKYVVIVQSGCGGCAELKKRRPNLNYLDVAKSSDGEKLANALGVEYVPAVISVDEHGRICLVNENMKVIKCIKEHANKFPSLNSFLIR